MKILAMMSVCVIFVVLKMKVAVSYANVGFCVFEWWQ